MVAPRRKLPMNKEIWKDIPGFEGSYAVSTRGGLKSLTRVVVDVNGRKVRIQERILRTQVCTKGYSQVSLTKAGLTKIFLVHRLVAVAFLPRAINKPDINHKNGDKRDNRLENLEWVSNQENMDHAKAHGLILSGDRLPQARLTQKQAKRIKHSLKAGVSTRMLANRFGVSLGVIRGIKRGRSYTK